MATIRMYKLFLLQNENKLHNLFEKGSIVDLITKSISLQHKSSRFRAQNVKGQPDNSLKR